MKPTLKKYFDFNVMYDLVVLEPYVHSFHNLHKYLKESEKSILMVERGGKKAEFDFSGKFLTYHDPAAIERVGQALYSFLNDEESWNGFLLILRRWKRDYGSLMTRNATSTYLDGLSADKDLYDAYTKWYQIYLESATVYLFTDGRYHEYSIRNVLQKLTPERNNEDSMALFTSDKQSIFQRAEQELSKIRESFLSGNSEWERQFDLFLDDFVWLYVADTHYDLAEIASGLKKQIMEGSSSKEDDKKQEERVKMPDDLLPIVNRLRELGFLRMELRQYWQWQDFLVHKILEVFERRHHLPDYFLAFLTHEEVCDLMSSYSEKKVQQYRVKREIRMEHLAVLLEEGKVDFFQQPSDIEKLEKELCQQEVVDSIIRGQVAYKIAGSIVGRARVIKWTKNILKELERFESGEIMIITQTKPDFLPYLRKAKAIVADEGGITSHVAIVSRELKIPSIIGTRIATSVIKNGDMIEIDTEKGVVKILENK